MRAMPILSRPRISLKIKVFFWTFSNKGRIVNSMIRRITQLAKATRRHFGRKPTCVSTPAGFFIGDNGMRQYKRVIVSGRQIDEHRLVMEQYLGRKLTRLEVVHHKDGNGRNNDIENLELMSLSSHSRLHVKVIMTTPEATRRGIKGLRSKLSNNDVLGIRQLIAQGLSHTKIAMQYNITNSAVRCIKTGKRRSTTI